jgi:hypothetical protein
MGVFTKLSILYSPENVSCHSCLSSFWQPLCFILRLTWIVVPTYWIMGAQYPTVGHIQPVSNSQPFWEATATVQNDTQGGILDCSQILVARVTHADMVLDSSSGKQIDSRSRMTALLELVRCGGALTWLSWGAASPASARSLLRRDNK